MVWMAIPAAISAIGAILPKTSTTDTSGHTDSNTWQDSNQLNGTVMAGATDTGTSQIGTNQSTSGGMTSSQQQQGTTGQTTNNTSVQDQSTSTRTASQAALDAITNSYNTAMGNATNPNKTNDLVSNILQNAAMTFAPTQAVQTGAGLYNGTSLNLLSKYAQGTATGQAAGAVLDYQTAQQQIANTAAGNLANATQTTSNIGTTNQQNVITAVQSLINSVTGANTNVSNQLTANQSDVNQTTSQALLGAQQNSTQGEQVQNTQQSSQTSGGMSVICTVLRQQGKLPRDLYLHQQRKFRSYPPLVREAYWAWGAPVASWIEKHPDGIIAIVMKKLMVARARRKKWAVATAFTLTLLAGITILPVKKVLSHG